MSHPPSMIHKTIFLILIGIAYCPGNLFGQSLERYSTLVDRIDLESWESSPDRSFDSDGFLLVDGEFFPTANMQYGIMCLNRFEETADSSYFFKATNQVSYLRSSEHSSQSLDGVGLGLTIPFDHKDVKAPWFSGLTQALAVSFILRYYQITNEPELLPLAEKLMYTMLQPQEKGGCLSLTREDHIWIELYPNSTQSPQILNGFIFAIFGLIDYCQFFPTDERAVRIKESCVASLKRLVSTYDTKVWTRYGRRIVYPIREIYLRVQIFQMQQLYDWTADPFFLRQMCIWSAFDYGQPPSDSSNVHCFAEVQFLQEGTLTDGVINPLPYPDVPLSETEQIKIEKENVAPFPWYGFTTTEEIFVGESKTLTVALDTTPKYVHILFKHSWDKELFGMQKWKAHNGISSSSHTFHLGPGYYQFAIFYSQKEPDTDLSVYQFELSDP
jgi:hypothetical protein